MLRNILPIPRFYYPLSRLLLFAVLTAAGCNPFADEAQSLVRRDVIARAERNRVELRHLNLSSSDIALTDAATANGIQQRTGVQVSFIYRCPNEQTWVDGSCSDLGDPFKISLMKVNGGWQYDDKWYCNFEAGILSHVCR